MGITNSMFAFESSSLSLTDKYPSNARYSVAEINSVKLPGDAPRYYSEDEVELMRCLFDRGFPKKAGGSSVNWDVVMKKYLYHSKQCHKYYKGRYKFYERDNDKVKEWAISKYKEWTVTQPRKH